MNILIKITLNFLILNFDFWESVPIVYEVDFKTRISHDANRFRKSLMLITQKEENLSMTNIIVRDHIQSEDMERRYRIFLLD